MRNIQLFGIRFTTDRQLEKERPTAPVICIKCKRVANPDHKH